MILTPLQKLPMNVGYLGKLIVAKGFKKLPKVQQIAQSGHTAHFTPFQDGKLDPYGFCEGHSNFKTENNFLFLLYLTTYLDSAKTKQCQTNDYGTIHTKRIF